MDKIFRSGVPYQIDINRLMETFPVTSLTEGRVIEHEALEPIVKAARGSQRYYGVINSWIGKVKNSHGIFIVWEPSIGIKVLPPADILNYAETKTRQKIGQTGKAIKHFAWVDRSRLSVLDQQRLDHRTRVTQAIQDALHTARKDLTVRLAPIESLPQPNWRKGA
jgi:hypothetical protein